MGKKLITEKDVQSAHQRGTSVVIDENTIITSLARDTAKSLGIAFETKRDNPSSAGYVSDTEKEAHGRVAIGADHGGFEMKEILKEYIASLGYEVKDMGTFSEESVDYPDLAYAVAKSVSEGGNWRGVIVDGVGIGSDMAANKVPGVRAAHCYNLFTAFNAREHNNANVLTLGGRVIGTELAKAVVRIFLQTEFGGGRHATRVNKIMDIEKKYRTI